MRRIRGFSLIELMVVLVLIAAATALAASVMTSGFAGQQLRGAAREIAAQLRYTRAQAITSGESRVFLINAKTLQWQAPNGRHGILPSTISISATGARNEQTQADVAAIRFFPEGAATGGRIVLKRDKAAWQVDVAWLMGEVTLMRVEAPQ